MAQDEFSREEFRQTLLRASAALSRVPDALDSYLRIPGNVARNTFTKQDVHNVQQMAANLPEARSMTPPPDRVSWLETQPLEIASSTEIQAWAKPWAEAVRLELFGSDAPPFDTPEAASRWILDEAAAATPDAALLEQMHAWERDALAGAVDLRKRGVPFDLTVRQDARTLLLPVPAKDANGEFRRIVAAAWSPSLNRLAQEADSMADATGWDQGQTVAFILVKGALPFVPRMKGDVYHRRAEPKHGQPSPLVRRWFDVRTQGADVTRDDLMRFFTQMRRVGLTVKKPVEAHEMHAYLIAVDYPEGEFTDTKRLAEYHERYPEYRQRIKTIQGLRRAVQKVRRHINATVGSE